MKLFQRRKENFVCGHCGYKVTGTGYTNHCPKCLYSRHVDINPGDRAELCQGLMKPTKVELDHGEYTITHRCESCGALKKNKATNSDNFDIIVELTGLI